MPVVYANQRTPLQVGVHVPLDSDRDMPRRPRPTSRKPPQNAIVSPIKAKSIQPVSRAKSASGPKPPGKPYSEEVELNESLADYGSDSTSHSEVFFAGEPSGPRPSRSESEEDASGANVLDAGDGAEQDTPRAAQWVDEEELDQVSEEGSESSENEEAYKSHLVCRSYMF